MKVLRSTGSFQKLHIDKQFLEAYHVFLFLGSHRLQFPQNSALLLFVDRVYAHHFILHSSELGFQPIRHRTHLEQHLLSYLCGSSFASWTVLLHL